MSRIPRIRDVKTIPQCTADKFDEEYLRTVKGKKVRSGYFFYPDGPIKRYLIIEEEQPLAAAWDDGVDGGATSLYDFFEPFMKAPQDLTFSEVDSALINCLAVSWQQGPDAHTGPGLIDAAEMVKSLLRRKRDFIVRLRRDAHTSFLIIGKGKIDQFYFNTSKFQGGEAETKLVHELTNNHAFLTIDVYEMQEAGKAEDWALVPKDFQEGMIRFYCCSSPHLILYLGDKELSRLPLQGGQATIGREPSCELVIDNLSVSRQHAIVEFKLGECTIKDLGSKNGTLFKGKRLIGSTSLEDGEEVVIGKHRVVYLLRAMIEDKGISMDMLDRTMVVSTAQYGHAQAEPPRTAILTLNGKLHYVKLSPFTIGSGDQNDLLISDTSIKEIHALLEKDTSGQWWISHKGGMLASTRINGRKIKTAPLRSGDLVQLGSTMLRFQLTDEPAT